MVNIDVSGMPQSRPEDRFPAFLPGPAEDALLQALNQSIRSAVQNEDEIDRLFSLTCFPKKFNRLVFVLYAPGHNRVVVSRGGDNDSVRYSSVLARLLRHPRLREMSAADFYLQIDFILDAPTQVDLTRLSAQAVGERRFEPGLDGLLYQGADGKTRLFLPGDAYVRSVMGMGQMRMYLTSIHSEDFLKQATFSRFRSESYLVSGGLWYRLYRGRPLVGTLTKQKLEHALELAIAHIKRTQDGQGKFLYYYDATKDSRRDHEHLGRDPDKNPFYNILRHSGGGLTCLFREKYQRRGDVDENARRAIDYLIAQTRIQEYDGRPGAYIYHEKKSKLGGTGLALYLIAEYQLLTGDTRYQEWADRLAWHLVHQITQNGEFIYYNIYLDRKIDESENQNYFSFYYPGEAICGLAKYLHLATEKDKNFICDRLERALHFLLEVRPLTRADQYAALPSDSWLMMGIMELWDFERMRKSSYADFVFSDADKMIAHMYTVNDAPYPDYAGAFYYQYGDHPYADGARCEGLMGAYALAVKMGDATRARNIWSALRLGAWAVMHLVNTEEAIYFARNRNLALGGIRFKYTRQWFRIDTIQHVASFFAKLLPYWECAEANAGNDNFAVNSMH